MIGNAGTSVGLTVNSPTLHSSTLNVQSNTTIGASSSYLLTVNAVANFTAPVLLQSSLTANSLTLSEGLTVQGNTVLGSSSSNTLVVPAAAAASSTLSVAGLLTASGGLAVSGGLTVSAGGITVSLGGGSTSVQVLSAAGAATFGSTVGITGALQASGNINLGSGSGNTLSVASTTALQAPLTAGSTVAIAGLVTASGGMTVTGQPDLKVPPMTEKSHHELHAWGSGPV